MDAGKPETCSGLDNFNPSATRKGEHVNHHSHSPHSHNSHNSHNTHNTQLVLEVQEDSLLNLFVHFLKIHKMTFDNLCTLLKVNTNSIMPLI